MAPSKKREKDQTVLMSVVAPVATAATATTGIIGTTAPVANGNGNIVCNNNAIGNSNSNGTTNGSTTTTTTTESLKMNGHQQEQELFMQAFEKPTQIYRYLRTRHETNPIFLNRTLSYMKDRMSRNNKKRATFKIDKMLDLVKLRSEVVIQNYLHIIFDSLYEKLDENQETWWQLGESVCVESILYKLTKSKRKDSTLDFQEIWSKCTSVVYNPKDCANEYKTISIPVQLMRPMGDPHTLYKLLYRIKATPATQASYATENDENQVLETPKKRSKPIEKLYGCELILYEKSCGFLSEGEYEVMLHPLNSLTIKSFSPKKSTWETMPDSYIPPTMAYDAAAAYQQQQPTLKFHLALSDDNIPALLQTHELLKYAPHINTGIIARNSIDEPEYNYNNNNNNNNNNHHLIKSETTKAVVMDLNGSSISNGSASKKADPSELIYNFMYSNTIRQQTDYTRELNCPWCSLNCQRLYALLKHLKLCHPRFNFTYQPVGTCAARIDVTINDTYDGSYAGSPYDLADPSGSSFARTCGPVRRTTVTSLLVCRPRRLKNCLDEFFELEDDEMSNNRSYVTGHNRLYHHTETCLPVHPKELDIDSEGESDPLWLRQKTIQMIDEFSDVNEGEKDLMKLWNLHVMKHGFVGDCQLPLACEMFLEAKGEEIIRRNLYRNFILHMCSLFDYGLISPETFYKTVQKLQGMISQYPAGLKMMSKEHQLQITYWNEVGKHKQEEQKLKTPQKQANNNSNTANLKNNNSDGNGASSSSSTILKGKSKAGGGVGGVSPMLPPKRTPSASKRASAGAATGPLSTTPVGNNLNGGTSKNVARKSADHQSLRERRSENGLKRSASISSERRSETKPSIKRRLTTRETEPTTPIQESASKRRRTLNNDNSSSSINNISTANVNNGNKNNSNNHNNSITSGTRSKTAAASSLATTTIQAITNHLMTTTLPGSKRLLSRRKSATEAFAGNNKNNSTSSSTTTKTTNVHGLRTRLSVPLAKSDRR